jgi:AraC family transcriptional regulator
MEHEQLKSEELRERVKLVEVEDIRVAVLEHRGDPRLTDDSVRKFVEWRKRNRLPPMTSATFNILYDDPTSVAPEAYRLDICAAIDRDVPHNDEGIVCRTIPGGRCAVLRHFGLDDDLGTTIRYLSSEWLRQSGEQRRQFPIYLQRVQFFPLVAPSESITDVFLPLMSRRQN